MSHQPAPDCVCRSRRGVGAAVGGRALAGTLTAVGAGAEVGASSKAAEASTTTSAQGSSTSTSTSDSEDFEDAVMPTKKLINEPETCVDQMLAGVVAAFPGLDLLPRHRVVIIRKQQDVKPRVALLSGGGSGHEPFCAGYVGKGMLTAAVAGDVFASPPASNVLQGIISANKRMGDAGVLVIVPNYTGDCLNFGLAVERARGLGIKVASIAYGEDCASGGSRAGRRGLCGLLFVYKLVGAAAEGGASLEDVQREAQEVLASAATMGVGLSPCSLPGAAPLFELAPNEVELGLGVHGEEGVQRMKLLSARDTVELLLKSLTDRLALGEGDAVVGLVNNLGATTELEVSLMCSEFSAALERRKIRLVRLYAGHLMTSLDMTGVHLSLLKMPTGEAADRWLEAFDAPTDAPRWPGCSMSVPPPILSSPDGGAQPEDEEGEVEVDECGEAGPELSEAGAARMMLCLRSAAAALIAQEYRLNELDSGCGDGDCGSTLRRLAEGAAALAETAKTETAVARRPAVLLRRLSTLAETRMGGTSGGVYSLLLVGAALAMEREAGPVDGDAWARAWRAALASLAQYSTARRGDRTMVDALEPACDAFEGAPHGTVKEVEDALRFCASAATDGCKRTLGMEARAGRAAYVDKSRLTDVDAGAYAVTVWLGAISSAFGSV